MKSFWNNGLMAIACAALLVSACVDSNSDDPNTDPNQPQTNPTIGQSGFVSADTYVSRTGDNSTNNHTNNATNNVPTPTERTVEEGDIYRVATDGKLLNLNGYRGLQIVDMADPTNPTVIGRVQITGSPVEMYQVGNRVYMLLNDYQGYYGSRTDILPDSYQGGLVVVVDISDPAAPRITGRAEVPGNIQTSRLTRGNDMEALYVVARDWTNGNTTKVKSFSVSSEGLIQAQSDIDLGGYVQAVQATGERLIVARVEYDNGQNTNNGVEPSRSGSRVSVIDISSEDGVMTEGQTVILPGFVRKKTDMDIHNNVLRVVSGVTNAGSGNTNYVQTFDASDIQNLTAIDEKTFGDGEDLFATLFLENKAFFVTYFRTNPFHAFEITDDGQITEKSEFIVSGWNDFFKPVEADTRLVGIGINDTNGRKLAVSLYDISDLTNANPMLARQEIDLDVSWSEANWDDRAFTVVENGTSVLAADGITLETGLVLLPFQGWDRQSNKYTAAVQIFTFSKTTMTPRGLMHHNDPVRRSFVADETDHTVGNLSNQELSIHDASAPDAPVELGSVVLTPDYSDFIVLGNYGLRRQNRKGYYLWWGSNATQYPMDDLQIVSLAGDVDETTAMAEIQIPAYAQLTLVGDTLAVSSRQLRSSNRNAGYHTVVELWDLSDPSVPVLASTNAYENLPVAGYYDDYQGWDCFDCTINRFTYWGMQYGPIAVGDSIVFPEARYETEVIGTETRTYFSATNRSLYCTEPPFDDCTYQKGFMTCYQTTLNDGTELAQSCDGSFSECTRSPTIMGETCVDVEMSEVPHETSTETFEKKRSWYHYDLHVLNVSNPVQPGTLKTISMGSDEEAVRLLPKGDDLYVNFKKPIYIPSDPRAFVSYQMRRIDLSGDTSLIQPDVNIPGELLDVEGSTLITRDFLWGQNMVESSINTLKLQGNQAILLGTRRFEEVVVEDVQLDGSSRLLLTEHKSFLVSGDLDPNTFNPDDFMVRLQILDITDAALPILATVPIEATNGVSLKSAFAGRALFSIPNGLLVVNFDDVTMPFAQAYFPTRVWPQAFEVTTTNAYFAAGPYGVFSFDLDEFNLLTPAP